ncbi:SIR2 family protein [Methanobacterium oryzae]|uniref:SIR2 family protein n=1 Tax=Methanobacterium oryzae TaxID=69540 RepID=UPI003D25B596
MIERIEPVPELQSEIIDAINNKNLAIFIGAGVSRLIGCDSWAELANNLLSTCFSTKKSNGSTCINYAEKNKLSQDNDLKKVITICHGILKQNNNEELFFKQLEESFLKDKQIESPNVYTELYQILHSNSDLGDISGTYITTNADEHFDEFFDEDLRETLSDPDEFKTSEIGHIKLYHIHGSISHRNTLVFTVNQYINRYNHQKFVEVLKEIFNRYVILFIGYGLDEFELIDFLITKLGLDKKAEEEKTELKNFIIKPYYTHEKNILDFDQLYYNKMGITVLGYQIDENGYDQLYHVLKKWNEDISNAQSSSYDSYKNMLGVVKAHEGIKK